MLQRVTTFVFLWFNYAAILDIFCKIIKELEISNFYI